MKSESVSAADDTGAKGAAGAAGAISGCLLWFILFGILYTCILPLSLIVALFTTSSNLYTQVTGPMVCPANTTAQIESGRVMTRDKYGADIPAMGYWMNCVNSDGKVVYKPDPYPSWIWDGFNLAAGLVVTGLLCLLLAAPAGILINRLVRRFLKATKVTPPPT